MAENEDGQERTEDASEKKLADSRKKGQVPRSKELTTMMVTLSGLYETLVRGLLTIWPLMLIAIIAVVFSSTILGGWTFNLSVKPNRMDPIKGVAKLFSVRSLGELGKALMKMAFIGAAAIFLLSGLADDILGLGLQEPKEAIKNSASLLVWFFFIVSLPLLAIAAIDVPWQLWNYHKR